MRFQIEYTRPGNDEVEPESVEYRDTFDSWNSVVARLHTLGREGVDSYSPIRVRDTVSQLLFVWEG